MTVQKNKLKKTKESLLKFSRTAAEHLFLTSLILILVSILFGFTVFYKYGVLSQRVESESGSGVIKFQENTYQKILEEWRDRGERFEAAKTKEYSNPFKP